VSVISIINTLITFNTLEDGEKNCVKLISLSEICRRDIPIELHLVTILIK